MLSSLLIQQWKEKTRAPYWQKSIAINIFLIIIALYLIGNMLFISFFIDSILLDIFPATEVVKSFSGILIFYFLTDLFMRFFMQPLPTLSVQPYLTLPIHKNNLFHYILIKSIPNFFNLIALVFILPFYFKVVCTTKPAAFCVAWLITVFSLVLINNYLNFILKKYMLKRPSFIIIFILLIAGLFYLSGAEILPVNDYFAALLWYVANHFYWVIIPIALLIAIYALAFRMIRENRYIQNQQQEKKRNLGNFSVLSNYGETGNLLKTELKLLFRNKRPKSTLYVSLMFLLYGFIFYTNEKYINNYPWLIFIAVIVTSGFVITYGQFFFSWEGSFFDLYLVQKISIYNYLKSKYLFVSFFGILSFIITLPYAFFNIEIAYINIAIMLYNIGVNTIILLFFCTYNTKAIDLSRSPFMNYQGTSASQFLVGIPIFLLPLLLYLPFSLFGHREYGILFIGLTGFVAIILHKYLLQYVEKQFLSRKYKLAVDFRKK